MNEKSTIQISVNTLERLKTLKRFENEFNDSIINFIIDDFEDETLTQEELEEIKIAQEEVKKGETVSLEKVAKDLGISLE
ncbi:MAG: hypothetical protein ABIF88_03800 [archaeon]